MSCSSEPIVESPARHGVTEHEFIALMSMTSATIALSIDTVLPAFDEIRDAFSMAPGNNSVSWIITAFFLGIAVGQPLWGPVADRIGRKPAMQLGLSLFFLTAVAATLAPSFPLLIAARFLGGIAAAGPRTVMIAIVRDCYRGDAMARITSLAMAVFLIVPIIAPAMGEAILVAASWRMTLATGAIASIVVLVWFRRCNETLDPQDRRPIRLAPLVDAARQIFGHRQVRLYLLAQVLAYGSFFPWLGSSELMIGELYGRRDQFALLFGANAVAMAVAMIIVGRIVTSVGTRPILIFTTISNVVLAIAALAFTLAHDGLPPFWAFFGFASGLIVLNAVSSPLMASEAMSPMGHIAGTAAAVNGTLMFGIGALLAGFVNARIGPTVTAFIAGFVIYGIAIAWSVLAARPEAHPGIPGD